MKILVVDDSKSNRFLLTQMLKVLGHESVEAVDGSDAIAKMKLEQFNVVFMDIEMPVMNGLETTMYIRNQLFLSKAELPIVAITAHYPETMMTEYSHIGFSEYLSKPITLDRIKKVLEKI